jgi:hypothetical protein
MNRYLSAVANDRGTALLILVIIVPALTLFCVFASNLSVQDMMVTANDKCHRYAFYDADGAINGTAKLISLISKSNSREPVEAGTDKGAPGIRYLNSEDDSNADADDFACTVSNIETGKVKFVKFTDSPTDPREEDFGLSSTVVVTKDITDLLPGGGAEFGNNGAGIGAQINRVRFRLIADTSKGSVCPGTNVQILGDYWLIVTKAGQTKGI